jgi:anti-sigma regulatory factor (Ser/Thr protein kinase)
METATYTIIGGDYDCGGTASKCLKELLKKIGVDAQAVRRTMIAAYEAEMNVVIHANKGKMKVAVDPTQVDVIVADEGPGIPSIEMAMREGFSTAPTIARNLGFGAGMGLPNIQRNTDRFSVRSTVGEGTQVRFTILLKPEDLSAAAANSVYVEAGRCQQCLACLRACPTAAVRVREGEPSILDHLCVDCTSCIAACEAGALALRLDAALPSPSDDTLLVLPASFLEQFGGDVRPQQVLDVLADMGFRNTRLTEEWEDALRKAACDYAAESGRAHPVLSPMCPAVVNLIQVRFPSLMEQVAPFRTPIEAAYEELTVPRAIDAAASKETPLYFVPVCPSQHSLLRLQRLLTKVGLVSPAALVNAVRAPLSAQERCLPRKNVIAMENQGVLQVSGMRHVMKVLDAVENGMMEDYAVLELYACDQGCFGSPVWSEDPFVARARWDRVSGPTVSGAQPLRRTAPLRGRAGVRLDADMRKAMEKLAKLDATTKSLPGRNCGVCGAPTCAALAEDIVMGRADISACAYRNDRGAASEKRPCP